MIMAVINQETYVKCPKCGMFKKPMEFEVKGRKRKTCDLCRKRK